MKSPLCTVLPVFFLLAGINPLLFSQIEFVKGYYINNTGEKITCFIKDKDWLNNPKVISIKPDSLGIASGISIRDIREFGIENGYHFIRAKVKIDISNDHLTDLSLERIPVWKEDTLFLKYLVEAKTSLLYYEFRDMIRFFYSAANGEILQLVYKKYRTGHIAEELNYRENKFYLIQLRDSLGCPGIPVTEKIKYVRNDLVAYFVKYNECTGETLLNYDEKQKARIHFKLMAGLEYNNLRLYSAPNNELLVHFDKPFTYTFGFEFETIMTFNRNKWSIWVEPSYHYHKADTEGENRYTWFQVDFKSIMLSAGIRYYMFLGEKSKIYIAPGYCLYYSVNSNINDVEFLHNHRLSFGAGYIFLDRYSADIRYYPKRDLWLNSTYSYAMSENFSLMLRYTLR